MSTHNVDKDAVLYGGHPGAAAEICHWMCEELASYLGVQPDTIDPDKSLAELGIASVVAVSLSGALAERYGVSLPATIFYEEPNIVAVARRIASPSSVARDAEPTHVPSSRAEPIAIVGLACRFPGAPALGALWDGLMAGHSAITRVPEQRWDEAELYDPDPAALGKMTSNWGGFIDAVDGFDADFFGISTREAERMDPQQRILLELAWDAIEDSGQIPARLRGRDVGVFVGLSAMEYGALQMRELQTIDAYSGTGSAASIAANRISYNFDLRGPSVAIDTACSSSLTAVHMACQSLRSGEIDQAIVAGVNVILMPGVAMAYSKAGLLAPDGRCKAFDAQGVGFARAEGAAVAILKPLSQAIADGDRVYATILGSISAQDGRSNGLMAPSCEAQQTLLRRAYAQAGVAAAQVRFVEAHGTGTPLGDAIELRALAAVVGEGRSAESPCAIGSIKTNLGHLEAAAGIAALVKAALALHHRVLPPSLHFETPNPAIDWNERRLYVPTAAVPLLAADGELPVAGVTSLGFGGSICHVVLQAHPQSSAAEHSSAGHLQLLPVSARSHAALQAAVADWRAELEDERCGPVLSALCDTARRRRTHHPLRVAAVGSTARELAERLDQAWHQASLSTTLRTTKGVVWVFPGQGGMRQGVGRELYASVPSFREAVREVDTTVQLESGWSPVDLLDGHLTRWSESRLECVQPFLFTLQYALARVFRSWGMEPVAVVGQSVGELAAAAVAGVLSASDAARLACRRARLVQELAGEGGLLVAEISRAQAESLVKEPRWLGRVHVAVYASSSSVVLTGSWDALKAVAAELQERAVYHRLLDVDFPAHSPQLDPLRERFAAECAELSPSPSNVRMISSVASRVGELCRGDAEYWWANLRDPVDFTSAMQQLMAAGHSTFLELSAHPLLNGAIHDIGAAAGLTAVAVASLERERGEQASLLASVARLYMRGEDPAWAALPLPRTKSPLTLPSYRWQRKRFWYYPAAKRLWPGPSTSPAARDERAVTESERCSLYGVRWTECDLGPAQQRVDGAYVVFCDAQGFGAALACELERRHVSVRTVHLADAYAEEPLGSFRVRLGEPDDLARVAQALSTARVPIAGLVYAFALDAASPNDWLSDEEWARVQALGCEGALQVVQSFAMHGQEGKLWLITSGARAPSQGEELTGSWAAPLWGLARGLAGEQPLPWGGIIDLDPATAVELNAADCCATILSDVGENAYCLRQRRFFVPRLVPEVASLGTPHRVCASGAYLVTGAFGELGPWVARSIVEQGARHLILSSRTIPGESAHALAAELRARGAEVELVALDVSDAAAVRDLLAQRTAAAAVPIRGVLHLAGRFEALDFADAGAGAVLQRVLAPKLRGACNLARALEGHELDFFGLFSSSSATLPLPGMAAYAAAHAFLDAFAHRLRARGLPAVSFGWGPWTSESMRERTEQVLGAHVLLESNDSRLSKHFALDLMWRLLSAQRSHWTIIQPDWSRVFAAFPSLASDPLLRDLGASAGQPQPAPPCTRERLLQLAPSEAELLLTRYLCGELAAALRVPENQIRPDMTLPSLGVDSLTAVALKHRVKRDYGYTVGVSKLVGGQTLAELSTEILGALRDGVERQPSLDVVEASDSDAHHGASSFDEFVSALSDDEVEQQLAHLLSSEGVQ